MTRENAIACDCEVIHAEVVEAVRSTMTDGEELRSLADFFKVLGDGTRVRIISALSNHTLCVCDLAVLLNMTKSAISHQMRSLRQANLVKARREGKVVYYALADEHVRIIFDMGLEHVREKD
jgi:Predicted transcriptional regulators